MSNCSGTASAWPEFEREILDVLTSIRHGWPLEEAVYHTSTTAKRRIRSAEQICALFRDTPQGIARKGEL